MGPSGPTPQDQLPLPVAELAIPLSVQELSNKNTSDNKQTNLQPRTSTVQRAASFNHGQRNTIAAEAVEGKRRMSLSSQDRRVITLPPKPSASFRNINFFRFNHGNQVQHISQDRYTKDEIIIPTQLYVI